jgi:c-di-GMP-binding flagellar brake protein YcgR
MSSSPERRRHYRAVQSASEPVSAAIHLPTGEVLEAEFVDLSARGAAVSLLFEHAHLTEEDVVELEIAVDGRSRVCTPAKVVSSRQDDDRRIRYGLQLINLGNLYAQLDELYARLFNRRCHQRGPAELDRRTPVRLYWGGHLLEASINELSREGMGLLLPREQAFPLERVSQVEVTFHLPGCDVMSGTAHVRHWTPLASQVLVGLEFDLSAPVGLSRHQAELAEFLRARDRRIRNWASTWA